MNQFLIVVKDCISSIDFNRKIQRCRNGVQWKKGLYKLAVVTAKVC
jgi:hypothetical protein